LDRIRSGPFSYVLTASNATRGVLAGDWSAEAIAKVLDELEFERHNPNSERALLGEFYRPHDHSRPTGEMVPEDVDPYAIAAYLRAYADWGRREGRDLPLFNVAVSFGNLHDDSGLFDIPLSNREVSNDGRVNGGWVGRSDGWMGDAMFDGLPPESFFPETTQRREGARGLFLMYIIHKDAQGRKGKGIKRTHHQPVFGLSIPDGGPTFRRIRVPASEP